jgi:hypothetical protein
MPAWGSGRSKLVNAALFGFAPLALVGIVAAAFVLSSSGKGQAASHTGFQAGAAVSAGQQAQGAGGASSGAPVPSASKGKGNGHSGKRSTSPGNLPSKAASAPGPGHKPGPKPKSSHRPKPKSGQSSGSVTAHNLGKPNFDGYCAHIGQRSAVITASNAYGWHCSLNPSLTISVRGACAWTYNLSASQVIHVSTDYYSTDSWQCWRTNGVLGQLNFSTYCVDAGLGVAKLNAGNAYGWTCTNAGAVNPDAACQFIYHRNDAFARFAVFANPYSWQCWD